MHKNTELYARGDGERVLTVGPLRQYVEATHELKVIEIDEEFAAELRRVPGKISQEKVTARSQKPSQPILFAVNFGEQGRSEIVDGNHSYVLQAQLLIIPDPNPYRDKARLAQAYEIEEEVWRDFLVDPNSKQPIHTEAYEQRMRSI